ncbi:DUF4238 domain-containing protein [Curtobacterium sp. MCLR17_042]|uniref:DUF4238 domain-containing protein n=1 Tax=Curtobacterium sp. MCLR17_042 TaxID=2175626 RepID=UPI000DA87567|nr:DUF4238 domain-containing protein [Curtobacterium sp. MCLR17_042]PZE28410.1 hypothetical protein DEJ02_08080 [Curtobacterium sp. MCLR17_042]
MKVRRAHMVSKGYIRAWGDAHRVVEVLDLEHGRGFVTSVDSATVVNYAYETNALSHDLEADYARIEQRGIPVIVKLRSGLPATLEERTDLVNFLDMHLDRGRYADQTKVMTPAVVLLSDGETTDHKLNIADRLLLSKSLTDVVRLAERGVEGWPWHVYDTPIHLATGDGAVLLYRSPAGGSADVSTVTFPLSPTRLLVMGEQPEEAVDLRGLNALMAQNSRRWVVGVRGTLNLAAAPTLKR